MIKRITFGVGLIFALALIYILNTIPPARAGAAGVLGVYILLYGTLVAAMTFAVHYGALLVGYMIGADTSRPAHQPSFKKAYYYASVVALGPIVCISLKSVGKLDALGIVLTVLLLIVGCVYVSRQTA
jgi:hypothetical protein